jgi:hypothetical protein
MPETTRKQRQAKQSRGTKQQTQGQSAQIGRATAGHTVNNMSIGDQEGNESASSHPLVNSAVADLPWERYVDNFEHTEYDFDYRHVGGNLSKWLRLTYSDGTALDIHIDTILEMSMSSEAMVESMSQGTVGDGGRIFPAELCPQTTPRLYAAKQSALEAMDEYNVGFITGTMPAVVFIITMGIGGIGGPAPRATRIPAPKRIAQLVPSISGFTKMESTIIKEAQTILSSAEIATIRAAHSAGETAVVRVGGRLIQYEPVPISGMTMFGENGFVIGKQAFASEQELAKTVLHELYRLSHSVMAKEGGAISQATAAAETQAAFEFAERASAVVSR